MVPTLLNLLGDPDDLVAVWRELSILEHSHRKKTGHQHVHKVNKASKSSHYSGSESEGEALVISHALQASSLRGNWIVDSGATCHMCGSKDNFVEATNQMNHVADIGFSTS